ncbi:MAG: hypothetical protein JSV99_04110 [Planctomycetota bacterium]|nr:MAG: hypothetical protein JSV99_04110 [Planctomycetota bacterium]
MGWLVMFLVGAGLLLVFNWVWGVMGIIAYWLVLPLLTVRIMKKWILPPWDKVKDILEERGYSEDDYLRGDWWKEGRKLDGRSG